MSAINLGPQGLPIQGSPAAIPLPPAQIAQAAPPQPPTAIPALDQQSNSDTQRNQLGGSTNNGGPPPSNGRGRVFDLRA